MRYLLDTNVLIDYSKNRKGIVSSIMSLIENGDELGVCAVNITEFYSGIPREQYDVWDEFFESLSYWEISPAAAKKAGQDRFNFSKKGKILSTTDALIASIARDNQAVIITNKIKDFPMKD